MMPCLTIVRSAKPRRCAPSRITRSYCLLPPFQPISDHQRPVCYAMRLSPSGPQLQPQRRWAPVNSRRRLQCCAAIGERLRNIVVIGAGVGGLTTAVKLARAGHRVTILEQDEEIGGRCASVFLDTTEGTFRFDTGPSLLIFPKVYEETFASLGVSMQNVVPTKRVQPAAYRVFMEDAQHLDMLYDLPDMMRQLEKVEPGAGRAYLDWLAEAKTSLEIAMPQFISRDFNSPWDMIDLKRMLPLLGQVDLMELLGQHHHRLARRFRDPRLQALFSFQDLYVGLSPYSAPGVFSLLGAAEITDGVHYPIGGFQKVVKALESLAISSGVSIRTGARVRRINTASDTTQYDSGDESDMEYDRPSSPDNLLQLLKPASSSSGTRVTGITLKGGEIVNADVVVSNRDVPLTYELLGHLDHGRQQQRVLKKKKYSCGIIAFNFAVRGQLSKLSHHNVFLSKHMQRSWQRATGPDTLLARPNFYVHVPNRTDPTAAPEGCESVMVLMPVANMQEMLEARASGRDLSVTMDEGGSPEYDALVEVARLAVAHTFAEAGICQDFLSRVMDEFVIDPPNWRQRYGLQHGAAFGLSHSLDQLAAFRPGLKDDKVKGLYMVGASARPGNGVPLVMIGADLAAKRVLQDIREGII